MISPPPDNIVFFYEEYQPIYGELLNNKCIDKLIEQIPPYEDIRAMLKDFKAAGKEHTLLIFDDAKESMASLEPICKYIAQVFK